MGARAVEDEWRVGRIDCAESGFVTMMLIAIA
jgi:hypothetical protein